MTTVLEPPTRPDDAPLVEDPGILSRPTHPQGLWSWLTTVDHKRIGILYGVTAFVFFLLGGVEALVMRLQLARPNGTLVTAEMYNQLFTMHGTTMIFLVVMPMSAAFFNYVMPLQIGARDVAFPRLNAFSYWTFLFGGIFMYSSFLLGGAPNGGWFGYAPNTSITFSPGHHIDYWVLGLLILGIASTVSAANFIVTMLNMRAPGMTLMRMPVFSWMTLVSSFLILFAMPVITIDLFLLMFDRNFGANFFNPAAGGDPLLWQHLFWIFGHPEVYILILPAMGMVSEILPVFSRKPLFGYPVIVFSGIAIGFMGWGVWVHHMFAVGLGPVAVSAFALSTMFIAVPTGVKIFNWLATMWKGSIKFSTAMLFAVGFVAMFTIGGLSGVTHAVAPHDRQQTDTYYVVAHFHYVLFGGALFGILGGIYYWWPKMFGVLLNERLGKLHFWTWFLGFNLTFGPMHWIGLQGMPRRIYTYDDSLGVGGWNTVISVGSFVIMVSTLVFMYNVWYSHRRRRVEAGADPWDARTLEWSISSPPPHYNFAEIPTVHALDEHWHRKYTEDEEGRPVRTSNEEEGGQAGDGPAGEEEPAEHDGHGIHMPSPSYYPLVAAFGLPVIAYGMVYGRTSPGSYVVAALGGLIVLVGLYAWAMEPSAEPEEPDGPEEEPAPEPALVGAPPAGDLERASGEVAGESTGEDPPGDGDQP